MAPPRGREPSIVHTEEREEFIAKLKAYHEKRGTNFDPEPKVGNRHVDLLKLYQVVKKWGGYDKVSDDKLAWRKLGTTEFNLPQTHLPALAYQLKSTYYKFLAAYEISTEYNEEPPPKEILEDQTASGGQLRSRTVENYKPRTKREIAEETGEGQGDETVQGTPVRDQQNESADTPGSGRGSRGLRQAPPQRVPFQPDTHSTRQTRERQAPVASSATPQPSRSASMSTTMYNHSASANGMPQVIANYEPRSQIPLTLRPVVTPLNNPEEWNRRQRAQKEATAGAMDRRAQPKMMLPGTGFNGPNVYHRCLMSLKSGIRDEQEFALHHLVKISMERGDKFRFESFPGLAEALIEKALEVSELFYDVSWNISYTGDGSMHSTHTLDGLEGTQDILLRIASLQSKTVSETVQTKEFTEHLGLIMEACLTLRNMVQLEENAAYTSELFPLRDFLSIALSLPTSECVVELKHYALDIAEQLTKYLHLEQEDPLYLCLLNMAMTEDRGAILTSLRAISRISMNLEEQNRLKGVPLELLLRISDWILLDDEELVNASLDFLYQYSAVVENVDVMLTELNMDHLVTQLTRLLSHGAKNVVVEKIVKPEVRRPPPSEIPPVPDELLVQLLKMKEPERSSTWLKCLFEEDKEESITQIALWQAYQSRFLGATCTDGAPSTLLPAAEFIKNVSTTFAEKATAQIQQGGQKTLFIIKGIRIRSAPVDLNGCKYHQCRWTHQANGSGASPAICGEWFVEPDQMALHILTSHLGAEKNEETGQWDNRGPAVPRSCLWEGCDRYPQPEPMKLMPMAMHVRLHCPYPPKGPKRAEDIPPPTPSSLHKRKPSWITPPVKESLSYIETAKDEQGDAAGIPLTAVLVLRNLARNLAKTDAEEQAMKEVYPVSYMDRLFKPVEYKLWEIFTYNRVLVNYVNDLLHAISDNTPAHSKTF